MNLFNCCNFPNNKNLNHLEILDDKEIILLINNNKNNIIPSNIKENTIDDATKLIQNKYRNSTVKKENKSYDTNIYKFTININFKILENFPLKDKIKINIFHKNIKQLSQIENYINLIKFPIYEFENIIYQGIIIENEKSIYGRIYHKLKKFYYEGEFKNNQMNGKGLIIFENNSNSFGDFKNNEMNGEHFFNKNNKNIYIGLMLNGKENGKGLLKIDQKSYYKGDFKSGLKDGKGIFTKGNIVYDGNFVNDHFESGKIIKKLDKNNNKIYKGKFIDNKLEGLGEIIYPKNSHFKGYFKNGLKNGQGSLQIVNDKLYTGIWENDILNGLGTVSKYGIKIKVEFENGKVINF